MILVFDTLRDPRIAGSVKSFDAIEFFFWMNLLEFFANAFEVGVDDPVSDIKVVFVAKLQELVS